MGKIKIQALKVQSLRSKILCLSISSNKTQIVPVMEMYQMDIPEA